MYIIITCMIGLKGINTQSDRLKHAPRSFKLTSVNKSRSRLLPDVQLDIHGYFDEFKSNSCETLEQSRQGAATRLMFGEREVKIEQGDHSLDKVLDPLKSLAEQSREERMQCESSSNQQQAEMFVAYPETKRCYVCKQMFQNYFKHISTSKHKKNQKRLMNDNTKFLIDQKITQLINSVNINNKFVLKETQDSNKARFQEDPAEDMDPFSEIHFPSKKRILSNGVPHCLKSSDFTTLIHSSNRSRKRSCFEQ